LNGYINAGSGESAFQSAGEVAVKRALEERDE
jgi:hypothetical protein